MLYNSKTSENDHNTVITIGGNLVEKQSRINPQQGEFCNIGISRHNEDTVQCSRLELVSKLE